MARRLVNPYYIHVDGHGADKILCFLGSFLALSVEGVTSSTGTKRLYGRDCGTECIEITRVTRNALTSCGVDPGEVEAKNLLHTFYNALRFLGILAPSDNSVTQRELCEWLRHPWDRSLKARLSDVAQRLALVYVTCRGVLEGLAASINLSTYTLLGSLLLLNMLVRYAGRSAPKPPAVLVAVGLLAGGCNGRCVDTLYERLSGIGLVEKRSSVERKIRNMCKIFKRALEIVDSLASRSPTIPYYCVQPLVVTAPRTLREKVLKLVKEHGEHACSEAVEICA